jgi:hypothetical protein
VAPKFAGQEREKLTTGLLKTSLLFSKAFSASATLFAPSTIFGISPSPFASAYSSIVLSWSTVGGASVILSSNGSSRTFVAACSSPLLAWSIVLDDDALAFTCRRRLATRVEAGEPALLKSVIMSRVLCCRILAHGHGHFVSWLCFLLVADKPLFLTGPDWETLTNRNIVAVLNRSKEW